MQNKPLININSWANSDAKKDGYSSCEGKKALKKSRNPERVAAE
jgi:hypothetical protein